MFAGDLTLHNEYMQCLLASVDLHGRSTADTHGALHRVEYAKSSNVPIVCLVRGMASHRAA